MLGVQEGKPCLRCSRWQALVFLPSSFWNRLRWHFLLASRLAGKGAQQDIDARLLNLTKELNLARLALRGLTGPTKRSSEFRFRLRWSSCVWLAVYGSWREPLRAIDHSEQYLRALFGGPRLKAVETLCVLI